jgi:transposase, IS5 family
MAERQLSLAEALMHPRLGTNARLDAIDATIDWSALERVVDKADPPSEIGRPRYAAAPLLKAIYLQALYDLSDPGLEEALADRLSFRRFCGYGLDEPTPDETTICRFRNALAATNALAECFAEVNAQLDRKGLILRKGTIVDASLIAAASRKPDIKQGEGATVAREPGARWTRKNGRSYFGYRIHVGVDQGSDMIRRVVLTPGNVNESSVAEALICGDERAVYGDKGYESKERRRRLRRAGIKDRICHRSHKHQKELPHWQRRRNAGISRRRSHGEAVFGTMKRGFGWVRARYMSFAGNVGDAFRFATAFNLRRAASLLAPA